MGKFYRVVFLCLLCTSCSAVVWAEDVKPEKFCGISVDEHDSAYYAVQAEAWQREIEQNPQNEVAWKYRFMALKYKSKWAEDNTDSLALRKLEADMEKAIPNTYSYNYIKYRLVDYDSTEANRSRYAQEMLKRFPKHPDFFDYDNLLAWSELNGDDDARLTKLAKAYVESGIYDRAILKYAENELNGLNENAILFMGDADLSIIPCLLVQRGLGKRQDICLIYTNYFFFYPNYRDKIYKQLGISSSVKLEKEPTNYEEAKDWAFKLVNELLEKTQRTVYLDPYNMPNYVSDEWVERDMLYPVALANIVCDPLEFNNMSASYQTIMERYDLDYLFGEIPGANWYARDYVGRKYLDRLSFPYRYYKSNESSGQDGFFEKLTDVFNAIISGLHLDAYEIEMFRVDFFSEFQDDADIEYDEDVEEVDIPEDETVTIEE